MNQLVLEFQSTHSLDIFALHKSGSGIGNTIIWVHLPCNSRDENREFKQFSVKLERQKLVWNLLTNVLPIFTLLDEAMLLNARILWPTLNKAIIKLIYKQINTENEFSNLTIFCGNSFKQDGLTLVYMV